MPETATTTTTSVFSNVAWTSPNDASAPILRRAAAAAVLHDSRVEIAFDEVLGDYALSVAVGS